MLFETLLFGSTLYAGTKTYQQLKAKGYLPLRQGWFARRSAPTPVRVEPLVESPDVAKANQQVVAAAVSMGLTVAGTVFTAPLLNLASLPLMAYIFAPTFQAAYTTAVKERRVNSAVMDATRITLCIIMRYDLVMALNACLQAGSQKLFAQAEADFQQQLQTLFGADHTTVWRFTHGAEIETALTEVSDDAVVALGAGDTIPAAGVVLYGSAWVDERVATGAAAPVWKVTGEQVTAASLVQSGQLYIQLAQTPPPPLLDTLRNTLAQTGERKSWVQQIGEASADRMAPWMFASFVVSLPVLGPNHAAAFLTTGFGAHLRTLGPYTIRNFLIPAAQEGIVIKDARVLEAANLVNTLIFDQRILADPAARASARATVQALRRRPVPPIGPPSQPFAAYVLVSPGEEEAARTLVAELELDDYLTALTMGARALLLENLTMSGRLICYVGTGADDREVMPKALVSIAWRGMTTMPATAAQVVLLTRELQSLVRFFELAAVFTAKQSFNLVTPIGLDLVDIATTLFLHWDLLYSVMFTYAGLLLGAVNGRLPRSQVAVAEAADAPAAPLPRLGTVTRTAPATA